MEIQLRLSLRVLQSWLARWCTLEYIRTLGREELVEKVCQTLLLCYERIYQQKIISDTCLPVSINI